MIKKKVDSRVSGKRASVCGQVDRTEQEWGEEGTVYIPG